MVSDMYEEGRKLVGESADNACLAAEEAANALKTDLEEEVERVMINDAFITNPVMHQSLKEDFIKWYGAKSWRSTISIHLIRVL